MADPKLLDDVLLEGQHAVVRQIGPELVAILVDANDLSDCVSAVVGSSELWGAGTDVEEPRVDAELRRLQHRGHL